MKYLTKSHEEAHKNSKKLSVPSMSQEQAKKYAMEAWNYKRPPRYFPTSKDALFLKSLRKKAEDLLTELNSKQT